MFAIYFSHLAFYEQGGGGMLMSGVRVGATMCQLYELGRWEGGADELVEGREVFR